MPNQKSIDELMNRNSDAYLKQLSLNGWWHSIELGDGRVTDGVVKLSDLKNNYARFQLPDDLRGQRVLDIGCWDGFYAFEAESHGAHVVAADCFSPETFFYARAARQSQAAFHELSVYELSQDLHGSFGVVIFQGVLYHLQHPLLGLQRVCEVTRDIALIGSHTVDNLLAAEFPIMRFYPQDELGGQYDNWWGPSSQCLIDLTKAAGFVRTELLYQDATATLLKAYRHWSHPPLAATPSLKIHEVANSVRLDRRLERRGRFALLSVWVEGLPPMATREEVRVEVGGFGSMPAYVEPPVTASADAGIRLNRLTPARTEFDSELWQAAQRFVQVVAPVPPGLPSGVVNLRVYWRDQWSADFEIVLSDNGYW